MTTPSTLNEKISPMAPAVAVVKAPDAPEAFGTASLPLVIVLMPVAKSVPAKPPAVPTVPVKVLTTSIVNGVPSGLVKTRSPSATVPATTMPATAKAS